MSHDASFKQAQTRDMSRWSIQKFSVEENFCEIFKDAHDIRKAYLLMDVEEDALRNNIW